MATPPDDEDGLASLNAVLDAGKRALERVSAHNKQLRQRVAELEAQLGRYSGSAPGRQPDADGDVREAAASRTMRAEGLDDRVATLEFELERLTSEYSDLERQNSNLLSLYVASSQIHATLVFEEVLRSIQEVIINLIGADVFSTYLYNESSHEFRRAGGEGQTDPADEVIPYGDNLLSRVLRSGSPVLGPTVESLPSGHVPLAVLPLAVGSEQVGVVVLFRLLVQKDGFDEFDNELFGLLTAHAATALLSSLRYRRLERRANTLQGLLDLFKGRQGTPDSTEG
ncbi:MAG: GAF domain-containing protein [Polyangiaceae bacterium]|nr:GAF domain-containing protein [Polyangiaceae bacterium]